MTKTILALAITTALTAQQAARPDIQFEKSARSIAAGKSPKFLARRAHGILGIYSAGGDLFYVSSNDVGETFTPPQRINNVPGEVSDHGENSPQLMFSPDESTLYAVWNSRDPRNPTGSHLRFSRSGAMTPSWAPAVTINDDALPVSHSFQGAAVAPDGTIYVAWLDGRDKVQATHDHGAKRHNMTGGTSSLYLARSTDGGKTFEKNIRIATNVCPCCRAAIGFAKGNVVVTYRGVEEGDIRDIMIVTSSDAGRTWTPSALVARDGWKIKGCPHVGASVAAINDDIYVAWFSEGGAKPAIYVAASKDGGRTFLPKKLVSAGTADPTHPYIEAGEDRLAIVFQAREAAKDAGFGKTGIDYVEVASGGKLSAPMRLGDGKGSVTNPTVAFGMSGRVFVGWTETTGGKPEAMLLRGRSGRALTSGIK